MSRLVSLFSGLCFRVWAMQTRSAIMSAETPSDPPRVHAIGPDPDRILLFGSDVFVGRGVLSHNVAFPGYVARTIARTTKRGVDVHIEAYSSLKIEAAVVEARLLDLSRYDAVLIDIGLADALAATPGPSWAAQLEVLLQIVSSGVPASARVFFVESPDPTIVPAFRSRGGRKVARTFLDYNARSAAVAANYENVTFLPFEVNREEDTDRLHTARTFQGFASTLAPPLIVHLETAFLAGAPRIAPIASEAKRQTTVDSLGILDTEPEERFDRIVAQAQRIFGTEYAAFNIIDRDRRWTKSRAGLPAADSSDRGLEFCNTTIYGHGALVVGDTLEDPRFAENAFVTAGLRLRFYVGYPIEAPDGQRIGALCVYDRTPRTIYGKEEAMIRDLASQIEGELWSMPHMKPPRVRELI